MCSLTEPISALQMRVGPLAKDFVFDKKIATTNCKLKEINRCISVCETYAEYEQDLEGFGQLLPVKINVGYEKKEA